MASKSIIVGIVYKPPDTNVNSFVDAFDILLTEIGKENKLAYILGDFNIDLLKHEHHNPTQNVTNSLFSNYHLPLINKPTRI